MCPTNPPLEVTTAETPCHWWKTLSTVCLLTNITAEGCPSHQNTVHTICKQRKLLGCRGAVGLNKWQLLIETCQTSKNVSLVPSSFCVWQWNDACRWLGTAQDLMWPSFSMCALQLTALHCAIGRKQKNIFSLATLVISCTTCSSQVHW